MPSPSAIARSQAGLGLPLAISVLLLLAIVAAGVTRWTGVAHEDVAAEVTSLRAEAAARSGLEWGRVRVVQATPHNCFSNTSVPLDRGHGCEVKMACASVGSPPTFALEAEGTCPLTGDIEVERTLRMRMRVQ